MILLKACSGCKTDKDFSVFLKSNKTNRPIGRCLDCRRLEKKIERERNKDSYNKKKKLWAEKNKDKVIAARKKWKENNIGKVKADRAFAKERIKQATPPWLTDLQKEAIAFKYFMADLMTKVYGVKYVVDHIIPLRGKDICGLNVPDNLEVITEKENMKKSNKFYPWRKNG